MILTEREPPAKRLPLVQATAPREIWLQVSEDVDSDGEAFPENTFDVSWCDTQIMACEVPYVRADLAAQPAPVQRLSDDFVINTMCFIRSNIAGDTAQLLALSATIEARMTATPTAGRTE
jgi:hypothetical protein